MRKKHIDVIQSVNQFTAQREALDRARQKAHQEVLKLAHLAVAATQAQSQSPEQSVATADPSTWENAGWENLQAPARQEHEYLTRSQIEDRLQQGRAVIIPMNKNWTR